MILDFIFMAFKKRSTAPVADTVKTVKAATCSLDDLPECVLQHILSDNVHKQTKESNPEFERRRGSSCNGFQIETWKLISVSKSPMLGVNKKWHALLSKQQVSSGLTSSHRIFRDALFERAVAHALRLIERESVPCIRHQLYRRFTVRFEDSRFEVETTCWRMSRYGCLIFTISCEEKGQSQLAEGHNVHFPLDFKDARASDAEIALRSETEIAGLHVWTRENQSRCVAELQDALRRLRDRMGTAGAVPRILDMLY